MLKVWGRGGFEPRALTLSRDLWPLHTSLDCAPEAATYLGFWEPIVLGPRYSSPPALPLPSSLLLLSAQPGHSSSTALSTLKWPVCTPDGTEIPQGQGHCSSPLKSQFVAQCLVCKGAPNEFWEWSPVFLGLWGICCMVYWGQGKD